MILYCLLQAYITTVLACFHQAPIKQQVRALMFSQWCNSKSNFLGYCITQLIRTNGVSLSKTQYPLLEKLATPLQHPRKVPEMKKYTFLNIQFYPSLTSAANNPASSRVTFFMTSICKWPSSDTVMCFPSGFTSSPFFVLQAKYYTQHKLRSTSNNKMFRKFRMLVCSEFLNY